MKWLITGEPGSGKTTLILNLIEKLKTEGIKYDGFVTQEIRKNNTRIGFSILDLKYNEKGILASKEQIFQGPKFGAYIINLKDLEEIGVKALERALNESDLIVCDEIGAMEFMSINFKITIEKILRSEKHLLATLHRKYLNYANMAIGEKKLIFLTRENWNRIFNELYNELIKVLKKS
jgi:nucleoside-triphosphatase